MCRATSSTPTGEVIPIDPAATFAAEVESRRSATPIKLSSASYKKLVSALAERIKGGEISGDANCAVQSKSTNGKWIIERLAVRNINALDFLYRPERWFFVRALLIGCAVGIVWETCFQSWQQYEYFHTIGPVILFWVPVAFFGGLALDEAMGSPVLRFLFPAIVIGIFMGSGTITKAGSIIDSLSPFIGALIASLLNPHSPDGMVFLSARPPILI